MNPASALLASILHGAPVDLPAEDPTPPCPYVRPGTFCDGLWHLEGTKERRGAAVERCPAQEQSRAQRRVHEERTRLAGRIMQANRGGGEGFDGYDVRRGTGAGDALREVRRFVATVGTEDQRSVVLTGSLGQGKTRLLLSSHLAILGRGIPSVYVTQADLIRLFTAARSFREDAREAAEAEIARLQRSHALHLDDLGDEVVSTQDAALIGSGLKDLLDGVQGVWLVALNYRLDDAGKHPAIGQKIVSRLLHGAVRVRMDGPDGRQVMRGGSPERRR